MTIPKIVAAAVISIVCVSDWGIVSAQAPNYQSKGNVESLSPVGCVDLSALSTGNTPADIYPAVQKCIDVQDYKRAARLFAVAGAYGRFDTLRVLDVSAHEVIPALQSVIFGQLEEKTVADFRETVKSLSAGSEGHVELCAQIRKLGLPTYTPTYMTLHGMSEITGRGGGLKSNFNATEAWESALKTYLQCS